jgi:hypothetical protein
MLRSVHSTTLEVIKIFLSALVAFALVYPFLLPEPVGLAKELAVLGVYGAVTLGIVFFSSVAVYANDLRSILACVSPGSRKASPRSVWWMLVLPYNFIEDFFIIHAVTESLRQESSVNKNLANLRSFGAVSGFGWCVAQIGSLIPNQVGSLLAFVALIMWVIHWRLIRKAKAVLRVVEDAGAQV